MIELLVMRHAKSDWSVGAADKKRPLNARGKQAAEQMAQWLVDQDLCPERLLSSSAARTSTTAMAVVATCSLDPSVVDFEDDLYLADAYTWQQFLRREEHARVLICGHNPGLDDLVVTLASDRPPLTDAGKLMTTAAIAHLTFDCTWSEIEPQSGALVQLVRPRELF